MKSFPLIVWRLLQGVAHPAAVSSQGDGIRGARCTLTSWGFVKAAAGHLRANMSLLLASRRIVNWRFHEPDFREGSKPLARSASRDFAESDGWRGDYRSLTGDRGFESHSLQRESVANLTRDGRVFTI